MPNEDLIVKSCKVDAASYAAASLLQKTIAGRLDERLALMRFNPLTIVDISATTGYSAKLLERRYKKALLVTLDAQEEMLAYARRKKAWFSRQQYMCADAVKLPLADDSIDLIFSNLILSNDLVIDKLLLEWRRVLRPNGLLLLTAYGSNTWQELFSSTEIENFPQDGGFVNIRELADALQHTGYNDVVVDREHLELRYRSLWQLRTELSCVVNGNAHAETKASSLMEYLQQHPILPSQPIAVDYEIIYGLAWKLPPKQLASTNEVAIGVKTIGKRY